MEIALSSFTQQFDSSVSVDSSRQRQQQDAQRQTSARNGRAQENQTQQNQPDQARAQSNQRTPPTAENSRVINGEVLSSETQRVDTREANQSLLSRSAANQQPSGEPDNRRISSQQAIQTFQENEEIVPVNNQQRQVSGIIDVFV